MMFHLVLHTPQQFGSEATGTEDAHFWEASELDPRFGEGGFDIPAQAQEPAPRVELDLTNSPGPIAAPLPQSGTVLAASDESKPSKAKLSFKAYIPIPLTDTERRNGLAQTYVDYETEDPIDIVVQLHGVSLTEIKNSLFDMCNTNKNGTGRILKQAENDNQVNFKAYIIQGGVFGKTLTPAIKTDSVFIAFKNMAKTKKGKEMGFRIMMENPKKMARNNSKQLQVDQALAHADPDAIDRARHDQLEMAGVYGND
ncbi:uncharacterized protein MELLADRAFT_86092 [Melampsora larici-populina 98AG31]|uniref:Uncharacterized protein n=1 Tax=Melampsora larici-populina (strain 98AG31 / pathotype 3-4-7) TaxID=747676 RepID=F4SDI0_MELLP|nr:uncharacterized protein MELLADRAFT_86092 [Melampsora larici-populina 98AG31]EGF97294.1 hypothetical protein MELLADRAFT_86092 [Melampsora larici-populina 98AG31]